MFTGSDPVSRMYNLVPIKQWVVTLCRWEGNHNISIVLAGFIWDESRKNTSKPRGPSGCKSMSYLDQTSYKVTKPGFSAVYFVLQYLSVYWHIISTFAVLSFLSSVPYHVK